MQPYYLPQEFNKTTKLSYKSGAIMVVVDIVKSRKNNQIYIVINCSAPWGKVKMSEPQPLTCYVNEFVRGAYK